MVAAIREWRLGMARPPKLRQATLQEPETLQKGNCRAIRADFEEKSLERLDVCYQGRRRRGGRVSKGAPCLRE